ncbi:MAG: glycosyltransferase family 4 protein, partial [Minisyncoccia bacterium]
MKIAYITTQCPWGKAEAFILKELITIKSKEVSVFVVPRNPSGKIFHQSAKIFLKDSIYMPLLNCVIIFNFLKFLAKDYVYWKMIWKIIRHSRNCQILIKNLAVLPKSFYISKILKEKKIQHIHAHWGTTTATMGYVISEITRIPWSMTLHRWDIKENNMLEEKARTAKFIRCISVHGKDRMLAIVGKKYDAKTKIIHMWIDMPFLTPSKAKDNRSFTIVVPANLIEVKGHKYLIEACSLMVGKNIKNFKCIFYGDGKLKKNLARLIVERSLADYIAIKEAIPHEELMELYRSGQVDAVVLPSIITKSGEHEGIPVALMEAMAYGVPVISTNTGGIPELLSEDAGIIANEKSPEELCEAIRRIMTDENLS